MRWKVCLMGIIRRTVEERCSSEVMLSSREMSRTIFRSPRLLRVSLCRIMDWVMTSSPTMSMRSSSFLMSTRIVLESVTCWACLRRARETSLGEAIPSEMSVWPSFRDGGIWERSSALLQLILVDDPLLHEDGPELLGLLGQIASLLGELDAPHDVRGVDQLRGLAAFLIVPELADHGLQGVRAVEDEVDQLRRDGQGLVSRLVQQCLQVMGKRSDPVQVEEAGHALDGVERPEDGVDVVLVVGLLFEVEDVQLDLADVLEALGDEVFQERLVLDPVLPRRLGPRGRLCSRGCRLRPAGLRLQGSAHAGGQLAHEAVDAAVVTARIAVSVGHGL